MPMTDRVIDLSESPARLSVRHRQVVIEREGETLTVPLTELTVLLASNPQVSYTNAVLTGICAEGGAFVICDEKRLPIGMLLPLAGNYVQAERFAAQARATLPVKKRIWQQIVRAKVISQGNLLKALRGEDMGLFFLSGRVRAGDVENIEAQASVRYWPALFGKGFKREPLMEDQNRLLNYGYAVLRAASARAICSAGLHPSIGVHHHNRYDPFCLADDLMEPFRPVVDEAVWNIVSEKGASAPLARETKAVLIKAVSSMRFEIEGESRALFDTLSHAAASMSEVFAGKRKNIALPEF